MISVGDRRIRSKDSDDPPDHDLVARSQNLCQFRDLPEIAGTHLPIDGAATTDARGQPPNNFGARDVGQRPTDFGVRNLGRLILRQSQATENGDGRFPSKAIP